jgi:anti-sigma-K factor RskA
MSDTPDRDQEDDRTLAGELALGVLEGEALRAAEARAATDAHFAALVADWHARFGDLAAAATPVAPPARVWQALEDTLFDEPRREAGGLWNSLGFWRWLAGGTAALAAVCIALLVVVTLPRGEPPLVAALQSGGAGPVFLANVDAGSGKVVVHVLEPDRDPVRVPELWVIPGDGVPRSLGLINRHGETAIALPAALRPVTAAGATLAVSLEPAGGSPTGKPTGPVIAAGKISKI